MLFSELINQLKESEAGLEDYDLVNNPQIKEGASLDQSRAGQVTFLEKNNVLAKSIQNCKASAILFSSKDEELTDKIKALGISWAKLNNPKLAFAITLDLLYPNKTEGIGIHPTVVIGKNVTIKNEVSIGPYTCIGDNCIIDSSTIIHSGVVIYENVQIGKETIIHSNAVVHPKSKIGDNCVINSNAVIGAEGFGFIPTNNGWRKMPQTGIVVLEDKVEIGSCSTIDRPAVGETRIGKDTKIDNLVQIGHGVTTGKGCAMAAQVGIAGGATIGNSVILAGQVGVANKAIVGDGVIASSKCGIHTNIEPGKIISGFPAMSNKLWLRCSANFKKLPVLAKAIRELERKQSS